MKNNITVKVTKEELLSILMVQEKGTFAFLHMETIPKMRKTDNPYFDRVTKITKGNILLGVDYSKRVQNNTENPDFKPEENKVGDKVTKCIRHNEKFDRFYLDYEWFNEVRPKSEFVFNGDPIEKEMFESFMSQYTPNKYGVNFQSVTVTNIREIHMNGVNYTVENGVEVEEHNEILNEVNP
jgi:hypothetical protein